MKVLSLPRLMCRGEGLTRLGLQRRMIGRIDWVSIYPTAVGMIMNRPMNIKRTMNIQKSQKSYQLIMKRALNMKRAMNI